MYSRTELEQKLSDAKGKVESIKHEAEAERRRLIDEFEQFKAQFEQNIVQLNANANRLLGIEAGKIEVYEDFLKDLPPDEPAPPVHVNGEKEPTGV